MLLQVDVSSFSSLWARFIFCGPFLHVAFCWVDYLFGSPLTGLLVSSCFNLATAASNRFSSFDSFRNSLAGRGQEAALSVRELQNQNSQNKPACRWQPLAERHLRLIAQLSFEHELSQQQQPQCQQLERCGQQYQWPQRQCHQLEQLEQRQFGQHERPLSVCCQFDLHFGVQHHRGLVAQANDRLAQTQAKWRSSTSWREIHSSFDEQRELERLGHQAEW